MRSSLHFNASPPQEEPSYACQWARSLDSVCSGKHMLLEQSLTHEMGFNNVQIDSEMFVALL